jgi:hypothetical protein
MPLHVDIRANNYFINQLHIGRVSGGEDPEDINDYLVVEGELPRSMSDWSVDGIPFKHRYGDGAEVCVMKAMEALYGKLD